MEESTINQKYDLFPILADVSCVVKDLNVSRGFLMGHSLNRISILNSAFEGIQILNSFFLNCRLVSVNIRRSEIKATIFDGVYFNDFDFSECDFQNVQFFNCVFDRCKMERLATKQVQFRNSVFIHTDFYESPDPDALIDRDLNLKAKALKVVAAAQIITPAPTEHAEPAKAETPTRFSELEMG